MSVLENFKNVVNNAKSIPGRFVDAVADIKRAQLETQLELAKSGVLLRPVSNDADVLDGFESHAAYSQHKPDDAQVQAAIEHLQQQLG